MIRSVPVGYLVTVLIVAWCTCTALVPRRMPRFLWPMAFYSGFIVNELPFLTLFWLYASTALALSEGDLRPPVSPFLFALVMVTTIGLVVVTGRSLRAIPALRKALDHHIRPKGQDAAGNSTRVAPLPGLRASALLGPFFRRRWDVERIADISYGDCGAQNLLDVYRRRSRPANAPVLIHLHGGAMVRGKKNREAIPLLYRLASHGWICISANYRLYPEAGFPDPLIDVKKVIAWVRTHGTEYAADTRTLFVVGGSAGAQLAAQAAMTQNNKTLQPGFETADTSMTAAVLLYGYYGWSESESWKRIQVSDYALPPVFMIHGDHDTLTPVEDARAFAEKLRAISNNPVVLAELPGAQHSFDLFHSIRNEAAIDAIEYFAAWVRSNQRGNRAGSAGA